MTEVDDRPRDVGAFIREQRRIGRMSLRRLSDLAGVSNPYLSQIERGLRRPSAEILRQIASALEISAESLYVQAGILDEPADEVDVVAVIRRDPHLDAEQKRALVHIYESFRSQGAAARDAALGTVAVEPGSIDAGSVDAGSVDAAGPAEGASTAGTTTDPSSDELAGAGANG